ncbi:MAG: oligosaccharide flippase family protein, partial [bacterium]|nr:oligosaccharide flippase family protein [bacterium]
TFTQLLLVVNLITSLLVLGLPNSINYFLARIESKEDVKSFISVYYTLSTLISTLTGVILFLGVDLISKYFNNPSMNDFSFILAILPWTKISFQSIDNIMIVKERTLNLIIFKILHSLSLLLIVFIIKILKLHFGHFIGLYILIETVFSFAIYLVVCRNVSPIKLSFDRRLIDKILRFSIPIGLATAAGTINIELDKLIIGKYYLVEQLAVYSNAAKEIPITILPLSITAVLMPQLVRMLKNGDGESAVKLWNNANELSFIVISFFVTLFIVFAPETLTLLYSSKYLPGVTVFRIYSLVLLLRFTYFGIILNSIGKTKLIFYSSLASLGINIVLNYMFYRMFGFNGPALATFISLSIINLLQLVITSRVVPVPFSQILPWKQLTIITNTNLVGGGIVFAIKKLIGAKSFNEIYTIAILLSVFWGVVYFTIMYKKIRDKWTALNNHQHLC